MGELLFVGLGLGDENDLSTRALLALRACDPVFAEEYTSRWGEGALERLGYRIGRTVRPLSREDVEGERTVLEALLGSDHVALLVVGEPFAATTHVSLRLSVEKAGHTWSVLHNASILTAAASLAGLSHYKFGRTISLPRPQPGFRPVSPYQGLRANVAAGLHTLILLDLDPSTGTYLTAAEALRFMGEMEEERKEEALLKDQTVVVVARAGTSSAQVFVGPRSEMEARDFGPPLHCLIVPSPSLHFIEDEALRSWRRLTPPLKGAPTPAPPPAG